MEQLMTDMQAAVNKVYSPLTVKCNIYKNDIDYHPCFYFHDKCNGITFGVTVVSDTCYPITCTSEHYRGEFVVQSAEDWHNHTDKFVVWKNEIQALIKEIITKHSYGI
jgi:hypothetical protein